MIFLIVISVLFKLFQWLGRNMLNEISRKAIRENINNTKNKECSWWLEKALVMEIKFKPGPNAFGKPAYYWT